ncbi:hypothetical protein [Roseateles terrae]|uniref:Uncharacterized protein n=1 Tax=Roseateles terrae TaxID=431060 RepID=A0ABR6GNV7_9BURK|nr:hypothetical protein [Roseateles terrae]MBB3193791.1 hypothetical protein [Roseateles terrae]OWQ89065.1 hypothetical protein CDN98_00450 [Roseateles terrae]
MVTLVVIPLSLHYKPGDAGAATLRLVMFAGSLAAMVTTMLAIGVGVTGQRMGVLWSTRNSYSLSRLQICMWTLLVLSAIAAVAACRAHGLFVPAGTGGMEGALNIVIPEELLWVMGISVTSAAAAPAILSVKAQSENVTGPSVSDAERRVGARLGTVGKVVIRDPASDPMVKDLFQGDEVSKAGTVDIGKLQQGVVTFILWSLYLGMLARLLYTGDSASTATGGLTQLPKMSDSLVYLLGISHAGYLAYKAAPATTVSAEVKGAPSPSTMATARPLPPALK